MIAQSTRALVFGAFMAALTVLATLASAFVFPLPFVLPLPTALVALRHGLRPALLSGAAATLITFFMLGLTAAVAFPLLLGLIPGVALGIGLARRWRPGTVVLWLAGAVLVGSLVSVAIAILIFKENPVELLQRLLRESNEMAAELMRRLAGNQAPVQQQLQQQANLMQQMVEMLPRLFPAILALSALFNALAIYQVAVWVFPRLGHPVDPLTPLARWTLPRWVVWVLPLAVLPLAIPQAPAPVVAVAQNLGLVGNLLLLAQGLAVGTWWLQRHWPSRWVPAVILLAAFSIPLVAQVLLFAGILDLALDFRKLRPQAAA